MKHLTHTKLAGLLITLLFCLPAAPVLATPPATPPIHHYNPLANETNITLTVTQIRSLDKIPKNPNFQADVIYNGEHHKSPVYDHQPYVYTPWTLTLTVPTDNEWVNLTIALTDNNTGRLCDISPCHEQSTKYNDTAANIYYNLKTGHWVGDDWAFWWDEGENGTEYRIENWWGGSDPSGYGRLNGCDDGSINQFDRDAELYFTITQDTPAPDGIPYWLKTQIYHLNATTDYTGYDPNGDGLPLTWDWQWGYDPFAADGHAALDPDNDGLNNTKEYRVAQYGSDPYKKDLYVELDRMADSPSGEQTILPDEPKELIRTCFAQHNIDFHLDDGPMGGSDIIPFQENTSQYDLRDDYLHYFLHDNLTNWRRGIFHWGVMVYDAWVGGFNFFNGNVPYFDSFCVSSHKMNSKIIPKTHHKAVLVYGSAYMHELGHNIGLNEFLGIDNQNSGMPWQKDYWKYRPYVSVMNYGYMYTMIGYSNGRHGKNDYDDWSHIDLTRFQVEMEWHPHP